MVTSDKYKQNEYTAIVAALELTEYVFHITDNVNTFPPYRVFKNEEGKENLIQVPSNDWLINKARQQAYDIYTLLFTANEIDLKKHPDKELKSKRLSKQVEAIDLCNEHLSLIQLCYKHFHLEAKRIEYWGRLVIELRDKIEVWNTSNKNRYIHI